MKNKRKPKSTKVFFTIKKNLCKLNSWLAKREPKKRIKPNTNQIYQGDRISRLQKAIVSREDIRNFKLENRQTSKLVLITSCAGAIVTIVS